MQTFSKVLYPEGKHWIIKYANVPLYRMKKLFSRVRLFVTPWTVGAYHAPLSMGFSRQEYWSGLPFPSPEDLSNPGIKSRSPTLKADALLSEPPGKSLYRIIPNYSQVVFINFSLSLLIL